MMTVTPPDKLVNYAFLLGGVTALIFGVILLIRQDEAIGVVALLLGLWWLIQGAFLIFSVFVDSTDGWWKLLIGLIGITAGIVVLANPVQVGELLGTTLAIVLGVLGILSGVVSIIGGLRGGGLGAWVFGLVSAGIGVLLLVYPEGSFTTLVTILAVLLIADGLAGIAVAIAVK
ncbi:MAG: DUF308 domain-containing protein [Acidimicrobiia bacterium]|jgi:uncharacterized membrane protein HdeD (DUF308 family)